MPFVQRNADGCIVSLLGESGMVSEFLPPAHPEVIEFLARGTQAGSDASLALLQEDLKLIRAIEDVIDLLISKNLIIFSDLPLPVQQKILKKRGTREKLFGSGSDILGSEEGIL